jgi:threonine dehydratase
MAPLPSPAQVLEAAARLRGIAKTTPLRRSPGLSARAGGDVLLKLETEQETGSFKLRGAYNAIAALPPEVAKRGVVASSAGNHGLGLSRAARMLGVPATVFVPRTAPAVKKNGILANGASIDDEAPNYDAAELRARAWAAAQGLPFVSPCAGETLLAGQGTIAIEVLEARPDVRAVVAAVSGGGLIGGIAAWLRHAAPSVRIIGAQGDRTSAMARSLGAGHIVPIPDEPTIADGLSGQVDAEAFAIGTLAIDEMVVVEEREIEQAIAWLWREEHVRAEGAASVGVAAILAGRVALPTPAAVVVSGGNIDPEKHQRIVSSQLAD